ncbi:MAG: Release factor glutamine methyltransferase [Phycisphaerae bacterium]|nr:Release factor glutamine methyltransferase [Phycisphaerae bacterium]
MSHAESQTWTIERLMAWTRDFLTRKDVEEPRLAAELLLAHALEIQRIQLYVRFDQPVAGPALDKFRELVRRAGEHEPIAYLVGRREFFSLPFAVGPDVLIPRPETETLVEEAIRLARAGNGTAAKPPALLRVLDVGTGSGAIAVALARHLRGATVVATDVSPGALAVAQANAAANGCTIDFRLGSLYDPVGGEAGFDLVCSNPPYISEAELADLPANVRDYEPRLALAAGPDGLEVIRPLIEQAPGLLADGGRLLIEVAWNQAPRVAPLMEQAGLADVRTVRDTLGHERVVVGTKKD